MAMGESKKITWRCNMARRGQGQGHCAGKPSNNEPSSITKIKTKMSVLIDYKGSDMQGSDFLVNTKFILKHMKSRLVYGEDIATAL